MKVDPHDDLMDAERPTLGVVAISYNEERDLPAFLEHLRTWADEIVIVDDGSTDETSTIAHEYGKPVTLIVSPRQPGEFFSHQRNKGIAASHSDWLLHMDIDERVPPELALEILDAIRDPDCDAYRFRRLNFFLHRRVLGGGWGDWNQVHLAKRKVLRFGGMYHESCELKTSPERVGQLTEVMWHLNDADYGERMKKSGLYCQELAESMRRAGKRVRWHNLITSPLAQFIKVFILKRGLRDGAVGLLAALHSASAHFRSLALVWDEQHRVERSAIEGELAKKWRRYAEHHAPVNTSQSAGENSGSTRIGAE